MPAQREGAPGDGVYRHDGRARRRDASADFSAARALQALSPAIRFIAPHRSHKFAGHAIYSCGLPGKMNFAAPNYCGYNILVKITYDPARNAANIERRDLPFDLFADLDWSAAVIVEDLRSDYGERRYRVFGCIGDRLYAAVFTPRRDALHFISLRKANSREVKRHG